jgi:hypothetical protein
MKALKIEKNCIIHWNEAIIFWGEWGNRRGEPIMRKRVDVLRQQAQILHQTWMVQLGAILVSYRFSVKGV